MVEIEAANAERDLEKHGLLPLIQDTVVDPKRVGNAIREVSNAQRAQRDAWDSAFEARGLARSGAKRPGASRDSHPGSPAPQVGRFDAPSAGDEPERDGDRIGGIGRQGAGGMDDAARSGVRSERPRDGLAGWAAIGYRPGNDGRSPTSRAR